MILIDGKRISGAMDVDGMSIIYGADNEEKLNPGIPDFNDVYTKKLKDDIDGLAIKTASLEVEIDNIKDSVGDELQDNVDKISNEVNVNRMDITLLKTRVDTLETDDSLNTNNITKLNSSVSSINTEITTMKSNFQAGCSTIAAAVTAQGVTTAASASPTVIASNIATLATNKYNAGVTYADGRVNTTSVNYTKGYEAGYLAGVAKAESEKVL